MLPRPMFSEPLHVGRPNVGDRARLLELINGMLDRLWFTNNGPLVREFEARVAELTQTRHCVSICNATNGIAIAAKASGVTTGDEVIVPAFTWVASSHALDWVGMVPVFCDVDAESGTVDVEHAERLIGPKTRGILGVHVFGYPCDVDGLTELADRHGIPLLFDAAHAFACSYRGKPIGGFGTAEIFSFHATKFLNTFEGGAIVTDDDEVAARARVMRQQGLNDRTRQIDSDGNVARMSEVHAAMGLVNLDILDRLIEVNERNFRLYQEGLAGVPGVSVRPMAPGERANYQYVIIEVDAEVAGVHRDDVHIALHEHNVLSRKYFHPGVHQSEPYRRNPARHAPLPLPQTEALTERVLSLPTGLAVGAADVAGVCQIIGETIAGARGLRRAA